jgi:PKD repeat protein
MKKVLFVTLVNLLLSVANISSAQNFSNKGKLFWGGHMRHIGGTSSSFALYITTDAANGAVVRVSIPGGTYNQLFIVPANSITVVTIPSTQTYINCTDCKSNNAVKIQSLTNDIVVYEHIYNQNRSDATLLIPVEALGSEYYAIAYTQNPVDANSRSQMLLIGVEDSTFVDITPKVAFNPAKTANVTYTIMLNEGEAYQVQSNSDMTGSLIKARSNNGSSCKKVVAFSGSSFVRMGCGGASSGDNLLQQLFPTSTWGTKFLTAPLKTRNTDLYRVLAMEDGTQVRLNGALVATLSRSDFYNFQNATPNDIETTKPVTLAQYPRSQNCDNRTGDPTLIVIPPNEQMVKNVTMYSSPYENITGQYLNVITKLSDTGLFRLDNNKVPFVVHPNNTAYAYAQITTNQGNHRLRSDSNFMVIAYGFGSFESYGYAAGTNIRNLVQSISASKDSVCLGDTFNFMAEISYTPSSIKWYLGDGRTETSVRNVKHSYAKSGNYVVSLVTTRSGITDCSSTDSTVYRVRVHDYPRAQFLVKENCLKDKFYFIDSSKDNSTFSNVSSYSWSFGDSTASTMSNPIKYFNRIGSFTSRLKVANNNLCFDSVAVVHHVNPHPKITINAGDSCPGLNLTIKDDGSIDAGSVASWQWLVDSADTYFSQSFNASFTTPGTHTLALTAISDSACVSFATDSFTIYEPTVAKFSIADVCIGAASIALDSSVNATTTEWDFAGTTYTGNSPSHTFPNPGNYNIKQLVQSAAGCKDSIIKSTEVFPLPPTAWSVTGKCSGDVYGFNPQFDTTAYGSLSHQWTIDGTAENHGFIWNRLFSSAGIRK